MRILIVNYRYFISGGPEKYMFNIKKVLEENGHEVIPFSIKSNKNVETKYSEMLILELGKFEYDNNWFKEETKINFEYLKLPTIKKYDEYLEKQYGKDYMEIPKNRPSSMHGRTYFNTNKSYKEYNKEEMLKIIDELKNLGT